MPVLSLVVLLGCVASRLPEAAAPASNPVPDRWETILAAPGPITHEAVLAGTWHQRLKGFVNLDHPDAAGLSDQDVGMALVVHVLHHPDRGVYLVDTGLPAGFHDGRVARGLVYGALKDIVVVEPLADVLARQTAPLAGVLLTHTHVDHVLGLPDVPRGTPVYVGPGDQDRRGVQEGLLRGTITRAFAGLTPLRTWQYAHAPDPIAGAVDVLGDGTLWALQTPGHTPGSASYLALTTEGPMLFVGDTSHTWWGWNHGVEPGTFTEDHAENAESLAALRALVAAHPAIRVWVGHELDGVGTGVPEP